MAHIQYIRLFPPGSSVFPLSHLGPFSYGHAPSFSDSCAGSFTIGNGAGHGFRIRLESGGYVEAGVGCWLSSFAKCQKVTENTLHSIRPYKIQHAGEKKAPVGKHKEFKPPMSAEETSCLECEDARVYFITKNT
jgi:hypothetical protein